MPNRSTGHTRIATLVRNKCEGRRSFPNGLNLVEAEMVDALPADGRIGFRAWLGDASAVCKAARRGRMAAMRQRPGPGQPVFSFAHNPVAILVTHVAVRWVIVANRSDAVAARLLAGASAVAVVVVAGERVAVPRGPGRPFPVEPGRCVTDHRVHLRACAPGENPFKDVSLAPVDGEPVCPADIHDTGGKPTAIAFGQPLPGVLAAFAVAVHTRRGKGEVAKVRGEPGAVR